MKRIKSLLKKLLLLLGIKRKTEVEKWRSRGVRVGKNTDFYSVNIDGCFPYLVEIGDNCCITHCTILAHDGSTHKALGYSRVGVVIIGDNVFIGLGAIVLCGVHIGNNVIVGAGTIVSKDIPDNSVVCGSPCRIVGTYDDYIKKNKTLLENSYVSDVIFYEKSEKDKLLEVEKLSKNRYGFDK